MPGDSYAKRKERDRARKKKAADQRSADQAADFRAAQREALRTHRANLDEPDVEAARAEARQQMARLREARGDDERFRAQHVRLVRASDADLNVELVDFPHCSEELKQASHDFFRTIFLPRVPCECCGEVKRGNNMKKAASIEQLRQHHIPDARPPADVCLCHRCHSFKPAATQPSCPYSRVNFPAPQPTPPELQDLTLAEKEVIRLVHPFQALLILPKGQQGARGQVIHLPEQPADKIATLLPADPGDVLLVAREKPGGKLGMYHRLRVDVVLRALQYLKQHNHLYRDVIIRAPDDVKTLFDNWERSVATAPVLPDPDRPPEATLQPTPSPAGPSNVRKFALLCGEERTRNLTHHHPSHAHSLCRPRRGGASAARSPGCVSEVSARGASSTAERSYRVADADAARDLLLHRARGAGPPLGRTLLAHARGPTWAGSTT